jgi:hypothetical protein
MGIDPHSRGQAGRLRALRPRRRSMLAEPGCLSLAQSRNASVAFVLDASAAGVVQNVGNEFGTGWAAMVRVALQRTGALGNSRLPLLHLSTNRRKSPKLDRMPRDEKTLQGHELPGISDRDAGVTSRAVAARTPPTADRRRSPANPRQPAQAGGKRRHADKDARNAARESRLETLEAGAVCVLLI